MQTEIEGALSAIVQRLFDARLVYCRLEATVPNAQRCVLLGTILDEASLALVKTGLAERFPALQVDATAVDILRTGTNPRLTLLTNVTGLHRAPSRTSEMMSELLNAWVVEPLMTDGEWTFVRQEDGYLGWVHSAYLGEWPSAEPTHLVSAPVSALRGLPETSAPLVGRAVGGTAVQAEENAGVSWVKIVLAGGKQGWVPASALRAVNELPTVGAAGRAQLAADARRLIGVPYRWGGCSALGIDCSGLSQLVHRLAGIDLPRDADMQFAAGRPVAPPFAPGDLLFFGGPGGHRAISHVGISVGGWRIIHSSGPRNGVYEDDVQAVEWLRDRFRGACTFIGD